MYNINSHYENIQNLAKTLVDDPIIVYLHPFGSTSTENIEVLMDDRPDLTREQRGPVLICYDQEPLLADYNRPVFESIRERFHGPFILINTEPYSQEKYRILEEHGFIDCPYFFHALAAADWFRGQAFDHSITPVKQRHIHKVAISYNRITSNDRVYRSAFVAELVRRGLLDDCEVSYSKICPDTGQGYRESVGMSSRLTRKQKIDTIRSLDLLGDRELRIDTDTGLIPNRSFVNPGTDATMHSLLQVVTETCFWDDKIHLTEKVFKPIVQRMPFLLLAPPDNLAYLRHQGFRTFSDWWDESYDSEPDGFKRIGMVCDILESLRGEDLTSILHDMTEVLDHNQNLFYSQHFVASAWQELVRNLRAALAQLERQSLEET